MFSIQTTIVLILGLLLHQSYTTDEDIHRDIVNEIKKVADHFEESPESASGHHYRSESGKGALLPMPKGRETEHLEESAVSNTDDNLQTLFFYRSVNGHKLEI